MDEFTKDISKITFKMVCIRSKEHEGFEVCRTFIETATDSGKVLHSFEKKILEYAYGEI